MISSYSSEEEEEEVRPVARQSPLLAGLDVGLGLDDNDDVDLTAMMDG